jgi:hypothetical protein
MTSSKRQFVANTFYGSIQKFDHVCFEETLPHYFNMDYTPEISYLILHKILKCFECEVTSYNEFARIVVYDPIIPILFNIDIYKAQENRTMVRLVLLRNNETKTIAGELYFRSWYNTLKENSMHVYDHLGIEDFNEFCITPTITKRRTTPECKWINYKHPTNNNSAFYEEMQYKNPTKIEKVESSILCTLRTAMNWLSWSTIKS